MFAFKCNLENTPADKKQKNSIVFSHISYLRAEDQQKFIEAKESAQNIKSGGALFGTYIGLELVNRVKSLSAHNFQKRAGIVAGIALVGYFIGGYTAKLVTGRQLIQSLGSAKTLPVWTDPTRVVNLDKAFWFLDEENGYRPSLLYPGVNELPYCDHVIKTNGKYITVLNTGESKLNYEELKKQYSS